MELNEENGKHYCLLFTNRYFQINTNIVLGEKRQVSQSDLLPDLLMSSKYRKAQPVKVPLEEDNSVYSKRPTRFPSLLFNLYNLLRIT